MIEKVIKKKQFVETIEFLNLIKDHVLAALF